jgi:hypothetical protein
MYYSNTSWLKERFREIFVSNHFRIFCEFKHGNTHVGNTVENHQGGPQLVSRGKEFSGDNKARA